MIASGSRATDERPTVASRTTVTCDYCHLPVPGADRVGDAPVYCCLGCRWAAEITGQQAEQGAVHWTLARLGLAIFLSLNVMMFTMALWTADLHDARAVGSGPLAASLADLFRYLCLVLSLPVLFLLGGPLLDNALGIGRRDVAAADLLILLGVVASYVYSAISVFRGAGHVYFEVGCAVLVMVTLGRWFEATGKLKTTEALDALEKLLPDQVRRRQADGRDALVPLDEIAVGDCLHILAGERVASDGRLISGRAELDQQMLTGESNPVAKQPGDDVFGGSLNLDGDLLVEITVRPREGSLARIVEMVRQARLSKGRYQRLADRVAGRFLSAVIVVALATFAFHTWRTGLDQGLMASLAVLLIACPCALGLATPMAVWTALGTASHAGVLFRHGAALEHLATVRVVRFDKTGTLTTGAPRIVRFEIINSADRNEIVYRAAHLARASTHVFSSAIARFLEDDVDAGMMIEPHGQGSSVVTSPGGGVMSVFAGDKSPTRMGSLRWLQESGLEVDSSTQFLIDEAIARGESLSVIGWIGRVRGLFVFSETLRPEARAALQNCVAIGCDVAVLTGDHAARGAALAVELGIPVFAELLPEDKVANLTESRNSLGPVAMVGDGINDAPALAASDLGIAMGCGADVSRESATVCLVGNNLARVPWAIDLARRTVHVIRQNLFWAFAYNTLGIMLAATGFLNPAWAALAMVMSSSLVVTNSLRLGRDVQSMPGDGSPVSSDSDQTAAKTRSPTDRLRPVLQATVDTVTLG